MVFHCKSNGYRNSKLVSVSFQLKTIYAFHESRFFVIFPATPRPSTEEGYNKHSQSKLKVEIESH